MLKSLLLLLQSYRQRRVLKKLEEIDRTVRQTLSLRPCKTAYQLVNVLSKRNIWQFRIHIVRLKPVLETVKAKPILISVKHTVLVGVTPIRCFPNNVLNSLVIPQINAFSQIP